VENALEERFGRRAVLAIGSVIAAGWIAAGCDDRDELLVRRNVKPLAAVAEGADPAQRWLFVAPKRH